MESLQLAQMLADLSSLNAAGGWETKIRNKLFRNRRSLLLSTGVLSADDPKEPNAAAALVTANKAIETVEKSTGITPTPRRPTDELRRVHSSQTGSRPGTGTATPARVDKFGRRIMMSPPVLSRSNSAQGSVPGTPKGVSDVRAQFHQHHHYPQHHLEVPGGQTRAHQQLPEQGEDDLDRASTLMALYEIRAKLKQQDNSSLMKAREKIADLAQKQQQQQQLQGGSGKKEPEKISSRFTFPK